MKTIKTRVLVVVFMLATLLNYANNTEFNDEFNVKKVRILLKEVKKGQQLTIKDDKGVIIHLENVNKSGNLIKFFNFSNLKDGNYTLELEKDFEIVIKSLTVKGDSVIFDEESDKIIFKPVVINKENKLLISKIAFDKKPLDVKIYYRDKVIYSETVKADETILKRVYSLDKKLKGNYRVVLRNNGRRYTNEFKI